VGVAHAVEHDELLGISRSGDRRIPEVDETGGRTIGALQRGDRDAPAVFSRRRSRGDDIATRGNQRGLDPNALEDR
jgi:hypothetical protein